MPEGFFALGLILGLIYEKTCQSSLLGYLRFGLRVFRGFYKIVHLVGNFPIDGFKRMGVNVAGRRSAAMTESGRDGF